jgi:PAS domain S-box-containing protein
VHPSAGFLILRLEDFYMARKPTYEELKREIAERKQVTEERNRIFNVSYDLFCIANTDGYFLDVNPAWEKTLGYKKERLLTTPFFNFLHPDDITKTVEKFKEVSRDEQTVDFETRS